MIVPRSLRGFWCQLFSKYEALIDEEVFPFGDLYTHMALAKDLETSEVDHNDLANYSTPRCSILRF